MQPKPPFSQIVLSVVVLAGCVVLASFGITSMGITWDPCAWIGGILALLFAFALAMQQYRGTFRCDTNAAFVTSMLLLMISGLSFLAFALTLGEFLVLGAKVPWGALLAPMAIAGAVGGASARSNLLWSRRLKQATRARDESSKYFQFSLRDLLCWVFAAACTMALASFFGRSTHPQYAENVSRDKAPLRLPDEAADISYCQGFRGTIACEFTIDESDFVAWVAAGIGSAESSTANISLQPIATPYTIRRLYALTSALNGPDSITIRSGLYYHWTKEDRGIYVAFDRTTCRAYYFAHFH